VHCSIVTLPLIIWPTFIWQIRNY